MKVIQLKKKIHRWTRISEKSQGVYGFGLTYFSKSAKGYHQTLISHHFLDNSARVAGIKFASLPKSNEQSLF